MGLIDHKAEGNYLRNYWYWPQIRVTVFTKSGLLLKAAFENILPPEIGWPWLGEAQKTLRAFLCGMR